MMGKIGNGVCVDKAYFLCYTQRRAKRWIDDETAVAVHEAHKRKETLHGKHRSYGGSEEAKWRGWDDVASKYFLYSMLCKILVR